MSSTRMNFKRDRMRGSCFTEEQLFVYCHDDNELRDNSG
jgi:hypothetical protein